MVTVYVGVNHPNWALQANKSLQYVVQIILSSSFCDGQIDLDISISVYLTNISLHAKEKMEDRIRGSKNRYVKSLG